MCKEKNLQGKQCARERICKEKGVKANGLLNQMRESQVNQFQGQENPKLKNRKVENRKLEHRKQENRKQENRKSFDPIDASTCQIVTCVRQHVASHRRVDENRVADWKNCLTTRRNFEND